MSHKCHWPDCNKEVPARLWGCRYHWYKLPKRLRDAIWRTYRPGQEIGKNPNQEYIEVAREVQAWCRMYIRRQQEKDIAKHLP